MGLLDTLSAALEASSSTATRGDGGGESAGAYWCHDCDERVPARAADGDDAPACPSCGATMTFERSPGATGCAC